MILLRRGSALLALVLITAAGCAQDRETDEQDGTLPTFAPELNVQTAALTRTPSGLYLRDLEAGSGEPATEGDFVAVHYTGWLPDGTEFDSSRGGQPLEFPLGRRAVIAGWDEGVAGMRPGGRRQLVIPPELAYGPGGAGGGVIPPNATLVFDVELLEVR